MPSKNKQLAINMVASFVAFLVNIGINFFLTPFIVGKLGQAAYGFIGLCNNIIGYTSLITIALNAMAGRFVTISYQEGDYVKANKYFSSVFYSNLVLSGVILAGLVVCLYYLEFIFDIPSNLLLDVKLLFATSIFTTIIGLMTSVFGVATFIKNRLELSSIRGIISNIMRGVFTLLMFTLLPPHLWYLGLVGIITTIYYSLTNIHFTNKLTPELQISKRYFDWDKIKELLSSGVWNLVTRLSAMLEHEFDLVISNLFISASAMGFFALTHSVPALMLSLFQMMAGVFAPLFTQLYASKDHEGLMRELKKSVRIMGCFTTISLSLLYLLGEDFYKLWLPTVDSQKLIFLTILATLSRVVSQPQEALWSIFTITNKVRFPAIISLIVSILTFLTVVIGVQFVKDDYSKLMVLAGAGTFYGFCIRSGTFLPIFGAKCLGESPLQFYKPLFKSVLCLSITLVIGYFSLKLFNVSNWMTLIIAGVWITLLSVVTNVIFVLTKSDREFIKVRILHLH